MDTCLLSLCSLDVGSMDPDDCTYIKITTSGGMYQFVELPKEDLQAFEYIVELHPYSSTGYVMSCYDYEVVDLETYKLAKLVSVNSNFNIEICSFPSAESVIMADHKLVGSIRRSEKYTTIPVIMRALKKLSVDVASGVVYTILEIDMKKYRIVKTTSRNYELMWYVTKHQRVNLMFEMRLAKLINKKTYDCLCVLATAEIDKAVCNIVVGHAPNVERMAETHRCKGVRDELVHLIDAYDRRGGPDQQY